MSIVSNLAGTLSAEEFDAASARAPKVSDAGRSLARQVLVDGKQIHAVTQEFGVARQQAHRWVAGIYQHHLEAGWVTVNLIGPVALIREAQAAEQREREKLVKMAEAAAVKRAAAQRAAAERAAVNAAVVTMAAQKRAKATTKDAGKPSAAKKPAIASKPAAKKPVTKRAGSRVVAAPEATTV